MSSWFTSTAFARTGRRGLNPIPRVTRKVDGKLDVTVYCKPTHTDRYLHFSSHHTTHVKKGLVRCLYDRARNITKEASNLETEKAHLSGALQRNGYTAAFVRAASQESRKASLENATPKKHRERASLR